MPLPQMLPPLLLAALLGFSSAIDCPHAYTDDGSGSCYSPIIVEGPRTTAYKVCADSNATLYIINNAFMNNKVQSLGSGLDRLWIGLTCLENSLTSCQWDNGVTLSSNSYQLFNGGLPNVTAGACVYMQISDGRWYSAPCSNTYLFMGCQFTPGVVAKNCADPKASYFRGKCYYGKPATDYNSGRTQCESTCGKMTSIHNGGMNSFVRDFSTTSQDSDYTILGLQKTASSYSWNDGSIFDYKNFDFEDPTIGTCVSMSLKNQFISRGQWINSPCTSISSSFVLCEKDPINNCDQTAPTLSPPECSSGTNRLNGSGTLFSPGYPKSSQPNHCDYYIMENTGLFAFITFTNVYLDANSTIQLYNSLFDSEPFITLTSTTSGTTYYSTGNMLRVVFNTNVVPVNGRLTNYFSAQYGGRSAASCEGTQLTNNGTFTSPYYPGNYTNNYDQTWCLSSTKNGINLLFTDFLTEGNADYVNVYDKMGAMLARVTGGPFSNHAVMSSMNQMKVVFHTDSSVVYRGFSATFASEVIQPYSCNGTQLTNSGTFTSPNYPSDYNNSYDHTWCISTSGSAIKLLFTDFLTERNFDYVTVFDQTGAQIAKLTGGPFTDYPVESNTNHLKVVFHTDGSGTARGFSANFTTGSSVDPSCTGTQLLGSGTFTSPNYPGNYTNSYSQTWCLTSTAKGINLVFSDFLTENIHDFVTVYDKTGTQLQRLTGGPFSNQVVVAYTNVMKVQFITDSSVTNRGFRATFTSITY